MSRHVVLNKDSGLEVAYGYDHQLSEYFIQVYNTKKDDKLITDKSTAHLIPENRISRAEFLEMLINYGVGTEEQKMLIASDLPI